MVKHCYNCENAREDEHGELMCMVAQPAPVKLEKNMRATEQYDWCRGTIWERAGREGGKDV